MEKGKKMNDVSKAIQLGSRINSRRQSKGGGVVCVSSHFYVAGKDLDRSYDAVSFNQIINGESLFPRGT